MENETENTLVELEENQDQDKKQKKQNRNRKRKKKFLDNAKSFGKKGNYGHGTQIEQEQFNYFINILDVMKKKFDSTEEKVALTNNVFDQTVDQEIHLSSNQVVSRVIENLLAYADDEHFEKFMNAFSDNFRPICSDRFASHVLQKIIEISFLRSISTKNDLETDSKKPKLEIIQDEKEFNLSEDFSDSHRAKCSEFLIKISKFLLNNLEDFVWDPYANHIMRTCILCLAGLYHNKNAANNTKENNIIKNLEEFEVPHLEWNEILQEYCNRLELWPQFSDLPYSELTSALLGNLCISLKRVSGKAFKLFGKKILMNGFIKVDLNDDDKKEMDEEKEIKDIDSESKCELKLARVFQFDSSCRLLETLLSIAGPKLITQLYAILFSGRIKDLSIERRTNFCVQKLLDNIQEKNDFELIFSELSEEIEKLLQIGHTGIVCSLANACLRLQSKQGAFVSAMQNSLKSTGSKERSELFFICLLKLKPYEISQNDESQYLSLQGSLITQAILKFNKPIYLINSILAQSSFKLAQIFSNTVGSYCADAFLESKFIGEKSREKLIKHLEGNYVDMAITKFGSRVIEKLLSAAGDQQKQKIVKELSEKSNQLKGTLFGRLVYNKFKIETYKLSPNSWKTTFEKGDKAEKLFEDIISK